MLQCTVVGDRPPRAGQPLAAAIRGTIVRVKVYLDASSILGERFVAVYPVDL